MTAKNIGQFIVQNRDRVANFIILGVRIIKDFSTPLRFARNDKDMTQLHDHYLSF